MIEIGFGKIELILPVIDAPLRRFKIAFILLQLIIQRLVFCLQLALLVRCVSRCLAQLFESFVVLFDLLCEFFFSFCVGASRILRILKRIFKLFYISRLRLVELV